ncbi:MAG TPA: DUF3737 domain-containing protein [Flavobacteriaceae bacterium]|nr:DUF3737 domain-containing protein [Flavobacteriaceae bacterium]
MKKIENTFYEGERPLYASNDLNLKNVKFYPGESALKESNNLEVDDCYFMGKYPFWHNKNVRIKNSIFTVYSRAAIWYSKDIQMLNSVVEAPKMFREIDGLDLQDVELLNAQETLWNCRNIKIKNVEAKDANYILMNANYVEIKNLKLQGDYSFQDAKNVVIEDSFLDSKDAFWKTENITVYNSTIIGEYLGWYSKNLRLVNCKIGGTQPLCYAKGLILENCEFLDDCDLAFEYSDVEAEITNHIVSVKNPLSGNIKAKSIGDIIFDDNARNIGDCQILINN